MENYIEKINYRANSFASQLMSNSKWFKLFRGLSEFYTIIKKCLVVDIFDEPEIYRQIDIPSLESFETTFKTDGIKDVTPAGPALFREIKYIWFPSSWTTERKMKTETLEPIKHFQNIDEISDILNKMGQLEIEKDEFGIKVYGYR